MEGIYNLKVGHCYILPDQGPCKISHVYTGMRGSGMKSFVDVTATSLEKGKKIKVSFPRKGKDLQRIDGVSKTYDLMDVIPHIDTFNLICKEETIQLSSLPTHYGILAPYLRRKNKIAQREFLAMVLNVSPLLDIIYSYADLEIAPFKADYQVVVTKLSDFTLLDKIF